MEGEAVSNRPESPKKRIKSNPTSESEAQPSNYSKSSDRNDGHNVPHVNGIMVTPTRNRRLYSSAADSSSERRISPESPRVQEEEVSSSENCVRRTVDEGNATQETAQDSNLVCDSASSSDSTNEKH